MKTLWYSKKWVNVLIHVTIWVLLFSLPFLLRPTSDSNKPHDASPQQTVFLLLYFINALMLMGTFYFNVFVLIPRWLNQKKYWQYVVSLVLIFATYNLIDLIIYQSLLPQHHFQTRNSVLFSIFPFLFILACSITYRSIGDKTKTERMVKEKENENLKTELSLLRSQVSPHFMFNVLNNMVALARKQSDQLEPSLIKLSSLMRYMIYEADEEKVPLEKEIEYLQSYIDLQKQRFGKNVIFHSSFDNVDGPYEIEPMLLIPFVENAIKHGTGFIENAQIDIELRAIRNILQFVVRNKYNEATDEIKDRSSGIGLANVKRRLSLLYGKNHTLLISKNDCYFTISLQLNLH